MITELDIDNIKAMSTVSLMSARNEIISAMHIIHETNLKNLMSKLMSRIEVELSCREQ